MSIENKDINSSQQMTEFNNGKYIAIKFISYKMRTTQEIRKKLKDNINVDTIEQVIDFLLENDYLNDELYAEKYIREKKRLRNLSSKMITYQLEQLGIKEEVINEKIKEMEYDESEQAKNLVKKMKDKEPQKLKQYLYSKGFSRETIQKVTNNN